MTGLKKIIIPTETLPKHILKYIFTPDEIEENKTIKAISSISLLKLLKEWENIYDILKWNSLIFVEPRFIDYLDMFKLKLPCISTSTSTSTSKLRPWSDFYIWNNLLSFYNCSCFPQLKNDMMK